MLSPLAHLLVKGRILPRHSRRVTDSQIENLFTAFMATNDFPYLIDQLRPTDGKDAWNLIDAIDLLCELRPVYTHEAVKQLPAQEFYAILGCIDKRREAREDAQAGDGGWDDVTEADWAALKAKYGEPNA